jgi:hypothetical protein
MILIDRNIKKEKTGSQNAGQDVAFPTGRDGWDTYYSRLLKLIPSEIIAFYMALDAIASAMEQKEILLWIVFGVSVIGAWIYLQKMSNVKQLVQRILTVIAFAIWVYVFGGPFAQLPWYEPGYCQLLLVVYTFFVPMFFKGRDESDEGQGTRDEDEDESPGTMKRDER